MQLAGVALLLAPLHVRPFTDDIWTVETQGDPRTGAGARRPTVVHDLVVSTLSAGKKITNIFAPLHYTKKIVEARQARDNRDKHPSS